MIERQTDIETADGKMSTFVVHPERGGPFPVILFYMDAPAIREELRDMARRFASVGYYVMLPNLYYRSGVMELGPLSMDPESPERKRMFELMQSINISLVMKDTQSLLGFAKRDARASDGPAGAVGYCMSGQYAVNAAATYPDRVTTAASIYGTFLVTDKDNSPHAVSAKVRGEVYFGCAETDRWLPPEQIEGLKEALSKLTVTSEVEVFPGTEHGFAFPSRAVYRKHAAEVHWERLLSLFARNLT